MQPAANVTSGNDRDWHAINWKRGYRIVKNLRRRIFRASREGNAKKATVAKKASRWSKGYSQ